MQKLPLIHFEGPKAQTRATGRMSRSSAALGCASKRIGPWFFQRTWGFQGFIWIHIIKSSPRDSLDSLPDSTKSTKLYQLCLGKISNKKSYSKDEDLQNSLPTKNHKSLTASYIGMISLPVTVGNAGSFIEMLGSPTRNDILQLCIQSPTTPQQSGEKPRSALASPFREALVESFNGQRVQPCFTAARRFSISLSFQHLGCFKCTASVWATRTNIAAGSPTWSSRWANTKKL